MPLDFLLVFRKLITTHSLSFFVGSIINIKMVSTNCFDITLNAQFNYTLFRFGQIIQKYEFLVFDITSLMTRTVRNQ